MGLFSFIKDKVTGRVASGEEIRQQIIANGYPIKSLLVVSDASSGKDVVAVYGFVPDQGTKEKIVVEVGNMAGIDQVEDHMTIGSPPAAQPAAAPAVTPAAAPTPPAGPRPTLAPGQFTESRTYTVKSGDTLSKISKETLGDGNRYNEIFAINQPMLKSPDKIYPGQVLRIPTA